MVKIRWIEPSDKITDINERGKARILTILLLVRLLAILGLTIEHFVSNQAVGGGNLHSTKIALVSICLINCVAYLISLSRFYQFACYLVAADGMFEISGYALNTATPLGVYASTAWLSLNIVLSGVILSVRRATVIVVATLAVFVLIGLNVPKDCLSALTSSFFLAISISALILSGTYLRDENEKQLAFQRSKLADATKLSSLGEMAGGVAHEINNPLAAIKNLSGIIQEILDDEPLDKSNLRKMALDIDQTIGRIATIVQGLRTFSRDGSEDPFQQVNIYEVIIETLNFCNEKFKLHNVEIIVENFDKSLCFKGRATEISQVLLNLLKNSYDAIDGLAKKWIRLSVLDIGDNIEIRVIDAGLGISKALSEKIFQPFFTTKELGKGTGLGLSTSHGVIKSHRGNLLVDTQCPNTCFVIQLPKA